MTNDVQNLATAPGLTPENIGAEALSVKKKDVLSEAAPKKHKRSPGEKFVDFLAYPLVNNTSVFIISVIATYLTSEGHKFGKEGSAARKVGSWFHRRGNWIVEKFEGLNFTKDQAEMSKVVFFSFFDGTFIAPFVKLLEDRREKIAKWFDNKFGTKPSDDFVYKVEPKQSWGTVISGRLLTSLIVVPTAVALDCTRKTSAGEWVWKRGEKALGENSLNDILFRNPGFKTGEKIAERPGLAKYFGKLHVPELFKTVYFEFFYTSVCTAGLYVVSRLFAKQSRQHKEVLKEYAEKQKHQLPAGDASASVKDEAPQETLEAPTPHVSQPSHHQRLAQAPLAHEVSA